MADLQVHSRGVQRRLEVEDRRRELVEPSPLDHELVRVCAVDFNVVRLDGGVLEHRGDLATGLGPRRA